MLDSLVSIYRKLDQREMSRGRVSGVASDQDFEEVVSSLEKHDVLIANDSNTKSVTFKAISTATEYFSASMSDLLTAPSRKRKAPTTFYVADIDFLYNNEVKECPTPVKSYLEYTSLVSLFEKISDHQGDISKLIFFHKEKIDLQINYSVEHLSPISRLDEFREKFIEDDIHSEQKKTIIKSVLLELHNEFGKKLSIGLIAEKFEEFYRRVSSSYQLYVSEFSFQKIKAEVEKSKFEFITRINKVFSDIQNQLLVVPASLILAGSQYETSSSTTLKNLIIFCGAVAFAIFMMLLILNQRNTLLSILNEINNELQLIKQKHSSVKIQFDDQYNFLETRFLYQYVLLEIVSLIVALSLAAATALFFYFSNNKEIPVETCLVISFALCVYVFVRVASTIGVFLKNPLRKRKR